MPAQRTAHTCPGKTSSRQFGLQGQRADFLSSKINEFFESLRDHRLRKFWTKLYAQYWEIFPWRLPVDEEPHCAMLIDGVNCQLRVAEWEWRYQVITRTQTRIRTYFFHKRTLRERGH
ncbi:hypothetical protein FB451DRAFT_1413802 [Mycena latifolia]|nr:hypothetical protein FB451DRAFT_1413802 [Mycena latifolia]